MRSVMEPEALRTLYLMLLKAFEQGFFPQESYSINFQEDSEFLYAVGVVEDGSYRSMLDDVVQGLDIAPTSLATTYITLSDTPGIGYIYRSDNPQRRKAFRETLIQTIRSCPLA